MERCLQAASLLLTRRLKAALRHNNFRIHKPANGPNMKFLNGFRAVPGGFANQWIAHR